MKIIRTLLFVASIAFGIQYVSAQKVKIKDKIAYVDEKPYLKVSDCGNYTEDCYISNLEGKEIISIDNQQNPKAPGTYYRVMFKGLNTTIEIVDTMRGLVTILYKNNTVNPDGSLNPDSVKLLLKKYGNTISLKDVEED